MAKSRKRRPSSKCSKRHPCAVKIGNKYLGAQVKTYSRYGKPEIVLTGLPPGVKLISTRATKSGAGKLSTIGGKAHTAAMKKRASKAARLMQQTVRFQDAADARRMAGGAAAAPKRRRRRAAA
jgi:hypothetical protein